MEPNSGVTFLLVEPFYVGSHKQLIDLIHRHIPECTLVTMTAKKWHWRARTSALHLSQVISTHENYRALFCSSTLNLAELVALRPDLAKIKKVVYFHENQLVYPVRKAKDRDFQYGYNQLLTCLTADVILFNSSYNQESFLSSIPSFLKLMPDYRPKHLPDQIRQKCHVVYFPMNFEEIDSLVSSGEGNCGDTNVCGIDKSCSSWTSKEGKSVMEVSCNDGCHDDIVDKPKVRIQMSEPESIQQTLFRNDIGDSDKSISDDGILNKIRRKSEKTFNSEQSNEGCVIDREDAHLSTSSLDYSMSTPTLKNMDENIVKKNGPLHIVWAHRWEHDKDPETFLNTLIKLYEEGLDFRLSVLGEQFTDVPDIFPRAKEILSSKILHWGYVESKVEYYRLLQKCDVAVSTSLHEFFGVSMLEAVYLGCYPLCPNRLVYPEIYHKWYLYNTEVQLYKKLKNFVQCPYVVRNHTLQMDVMKYCSKKILPEIAKFID